MGKEEPNERRSRSGDTLPAKNILEIVEKRKADSPYPDITRPIADARCHGGVISKINLCKNVREYIQLGRGTSLRLNLQNLWRPQSSQLRLGNCKEEVHRTWRLSQGQITRRTQDQSHKDIWCRNIHLKWIQNYRQIVCEDHENPQFVPKPDESYKLQLKKRQLGC